MDRRQAVQIGLRVARWLERIGVPRLSLGLMTRLTVLSPGDPRAWRSLVDRHEKAGRHERALACGESLARIANDEASWRRVAALAESLERPRQAAEAWEQLLRIAPEALDLWKHRADSCRRAGQLEEAATAYGRLAELDPLRELSWRVRAANQCSRSGEKQLELTQRARIRELVPDDPKNLRKLGQLEEEAAHWDTAAEIFADLVRVRPDIRSQRAFARASQRAGRDADALEAWMQVAKLEPDDARVWRRIALLAMRAGRWNLAEQHTHDLLARNSDDHEARRWLASVLYRRGDPAGALVQMLELARPGVPDHANIAVAAIRLALRAGLVDRACRESWALITTLERADLIVRIVRQFRLAGVGETLAKYVGDVAVPSPDLARLATTTLLALGRLAAAQATMPPCDELDRSDALRREARALTFGDPATGGLPQSDDVSPLSGSHEVWLLIEGKAEVGIVAGQIPASATVTTILHSPAIDATKERLRAAEVAGEIHTTADLLPPPVGKHDTRIFEVAQPAAEAVLEGLWKALDRAGHARLLRYSEPLVNLLVDELAQRTRLVLGLHDAIIDAQPDVVYLLFDAGELMQPLLRTLQADARAPAVRVACGSRDAEVRSAFVDNILDRPPTRPPGKAPPEEDLPTSFPGTATAPLLDHARSGSALLAIDLRDRNYRNVARALATTVPARRDVIVCHFGRLPNANETIEDLWQELREKHGTSVVVSQIPRDAPRDKTIVCWASRFAERSRPHLQMLAFDGATPVVDALVPVVAAFLHGHATQLLSLALRIETFLDSTPPDYILISPGWSPATRILVLAARERSIPTVDVQTLMVRRTPRYRPPIADWATALDEEQRTIYTTHFGFDAQRICLTGYPSLDVVAVRLAAQSPADRLEHLGVDPKNPPPVVVLATQPDELPMFLAIADAVIDACRSIDPVLLIIKVHPREGDDRLARFRQLVADKNATSFCRVAREDDTYELIEAAELVLTSFSNVGIEAAALGTNVIAVNLTGHKLEIDLAAMGVALPAESPAEVSRLVRGLLSGDPAMQLQAHERRKDYLRRNPHMRPGNAARRIIELAESLAEP